MSDTWSDIQEIKSKRSSLREKLLKRRKQNEGLVADLTGAKPTEEPKPETKPEPVKDEKARASPVPVAVEPEISPCPSPLHSTDKPSPKPDTAPVTESAVERHLLRLLSDVTLELPLDLAGVLSALVKLMKVPEVPEKMVEDLLTKLSVQKLIALTRIKNDKGVEVVSIDSPDYSSISALLAVDSGRKRPHSKDGSQKQTEPEVKRARKEKTGTGESVESLLSMQSTRERETKKVSDEIQNLLSATTAKEKSLVEKFRSQGGTQVMEFCPYGTKEDCNKSQGPGKCQKLHFRKIINKHTDEMLGDCSFLNTCFHMDTCKYVHYEIEKRSEPNPTTTVARPVEVKSVFSQTTLYPNQWICCDLRDFDMSVLGKCAVVMADPPWDIHMELPYGTMGDDEMRALDVPNLQDDGYLFLWVTGRAMELGRECLKIWGYERIDELIWVKTNQLQRIIRTGRTGHWLNHGKEHCLIGVKGKPRGFNRGLDADVIVAEVRATSHKPDEVYGIIERLAPGMRKVELFGRPHNVQPNWITLGNQLDGVKLLDPEIVRRFKERYPNGCMPQKKSS